MSGFVDGYPDDESWLDSHEALVTQERALILSSARGFAEETQVRLHRTGVVVAHLRGTFGVELAEVHDVPTAIVKTKVARSEQRGRLPAIVIPIDRAGLLVLMMEFAPDLAPRIMVRAQDDVALFVVDADDRPGLATWPVGVFDPLRYS